MTTAILPVIIAPTVNPPKVSSLLTIASDAKTIKGQKKGYLTAIQYLAPSDVSGIVNLCAYASEGCKLACLNSAGRASFDTNIEKARINRTIWFVRFKPQYWTRLVKELQSFIRKANRMNLTPVFRPNGTSDQPFERMKIVGTEFNGLTIFEAFPELQIYDYTKFPHDKRRQIPNNYHLTYSYSEDTTTLMLANNLLNGRNVAVVFNVCEFNNKGKHHNKCTCAFPAYWNGYKVISGDESDLRFLDESGVIVALHAKGDARTDESGFVVNIN